MSVKCEWPGCKRDAVCQAEFWNAFDTPEHHDVCEKHRKGTDEKRQLPLGAENHLPPALIDKEQYPPLSGAAEGWAYR